MTTKNIQITFNGVDYDVHPDIPLAWILFVVRNCALYPREFDHKTYLKALEQFWYGGRFKKSTQQAVLKDCHNVLTVLQSPQLKPTL